MEKLSALIRKGIPLTKGQATGRYYNQYDQTACVLGTAQIGLMGKYPSNEDLRMGGCLTILDDEHYGNIFYDTPQWVPDHQDLWTYITNLNDRDGISREHIAEILESHGL